MPAKRSRVSRGSAAPPEIRYFTLPPSASCTLPKRKRPASIPSFFPSMRLSSPPQLNAVSKAGPRECTSVRIRRSRSCQSAGTPTIAVTRPSFRPSARRSPFSSSRYAMRDPRDSGRTSPQVNSKVWWSGRTDITRSPADSGNTGASAATSDVKFACVSLTPLG